MPDVDRWEIQGFINDYGNGRAAWSTGVNGSAGVLAFLADALSDTDATTFLIRRSSGNDVEHVRLVDGDARERLARHLNMQSTASMDQCLRHADDLLAVIAGREG